MVKKAPTKADSHVVKQAAEEDIEVHGPVLIYIHCVRLLWRMNDDDQSIIITTPLNE